MLFAIGCGGGGSGSSDTAAISTAPIDLDPGQTTAMMAWEPSEGQVLAYLVFQSHDDDSFEFLATVPAPEIEISGAPGDSIRILVVALGAANSESVASAPSPPVRFYAAVDTVSAVSAATTAGPSLTTSAVSPQTESVESDSSDNASDSTPADVAETTEAPEEADSDLVSIHQVLREQLVGSGARFPFAAHAPEVGQWIQSFVDAEVGAGVSLAGLGEFDEDALRDLVWVDSSGQLFISEGSLVASVEDLPTTFVEAIRLGPTERFVGLDDFDGDGIGDWLVEDTSTGDAWILVDGSQDIFFEHDAASNADLQLVGHGDFDGDGSAELLWQHADSSFQIGIADDERATLAWFAPDDTDSAAAAATSQLLTVADLDGDGRDDLMFRTSDGRLAFALSQSDSTSPEFEWTFGPESSTEGRELIATLDLDQNGGIEIAWLIDGALEVWNLDDAL